MSREYIFIDDSGDPGLRGSSTTRFIIAAVLVVDQSKLGRLEAALNDFRAGLGWDERHEFKFNTTKKSIVADLLRFIRQFEFKSYAIVIDKTKITKVPQLASGETLYNYAIKELLLKMRLSEPTIVIDGRAGKQYSKKVRTYLRQALKLRGVQKCEISFADSKKDQLVQLADIVAGSVARSFDKTKSDHNDYIKLLKSKMKAIYEITP